MSKNKKAIFNTITASTLIAGAGIAAIAQACAPDSPVTPNLQNSIRVFEELNGYTQGTSLSTEATHFFTTLQAGIRTADTPSQPSNANIVNIQINTSISNAISADSTGEFLSIAANVLTIGVAGQQNPGGDSRFTNNRAVQISGIRYRDSEIIDGGSILSPSTSFQSVSNTTLINNAVALLASSTSVPDEPNAAALWNALQASVIQIGSTNSSVIINDVTINMGTGSSNVIVTSNSLTITRGDISIAASGDAGVNFNSLFNNDLDMNGLVISNIQVIAGEIQSLGAGNVTGLNGVSNRTIIDNNIQNLYNANTAPQGGLVLYNLFQSAIQTIQGNETASITRFTIADLNWIQSDAVLNGDSTSNISIAATTFTGEPVIRIEASGGTQTMFESRRSILIQNVIVNNGTIVSADPIATDSFYATTSFVGAITREIQEMTNTDIPLNNTLSNAIVTAIQAVPRLAPSSAIELTFVSIRDFTDDVTITETITEDVYDISFAQDSITFNFLSTDNTASNSTITNSLGVFTIGNISVDSTDPSNLIVQVPSIELNDLLPLDPSSLDGEALLLNTAIDLLTNGGISSSTNQSVLLNAITTEIQTQAGDNSVINSIEYLGTNSSSSVAANPSGGNFNLIFGAGSLLIDVTTEAGDSVFWSNTGNFTLSQITVVDQVFSGTITTSSNLEPYNNVVSATYRAFSEITSYTASQPPVGISDLATALLARIEAALDNGVTLSNFSLTTPLLATLDNSAGTSVQISQESAVRIAIVTSTPAGTIYGQIYGEIVNPVDGTIPDLSGLVLDFS